MSDRIPRLGFSFWAALAIVSSPAWAWAQARPVDPPGTAVVGPGAGAEAGAEVVKDDGPSLPHEVQIVRFQAPEGVHVEVLGPAPEPIAVPPGSPTVYGLKVGVGYRLRVWDIPHRPGAELFPVLEVVGHLHRPKGIDPVKFPIRVVFNEDDFVDAVDRGRLVTEVIYLEDPEQALPIALPKNEIPIVTLNPAEEPLKVAAALGRVMVIVRNGGRRPTNEELQYPPGVWPGLGGVTPTRCPFSNGEGSPCKLPCGPVCGTPPPPGKPWAPRDEYLCDGGDQLEPAHFAGDGGLQGIDPRDAVIQFNDTRDRILPTNRVCVYAPRFAAVRVGTGPNSTLAVERSSHADVIAAGAALAAPLGSKRLVQKQAAEIDRTHVRASGMRGRVYAGDHTELRVLGGYDIMTHVAGKVLVQGVDQEKLRQKPGALREQIHFLGIKSAESAIVTGIVQGAGEKVTIWKPKETVGVEEPPKRPGLAVIKRVSATEAEPGDRLTYVIQYRNMGNTPIRAVSILDSLLPRLGYVAGTAQGPKGTVFTAGENRVGSMELRWDLQGALAPGQEGYVSFQALVR